MLAGTKNDNNNNVSSPSLQSSTPFVNFWACGFLLMGKKIIVVLMICSADIAVSVAAWSVACMNCVWPNGWTYQAMGVGQGQDYIVLFRSLVSQNLVSLCLFLCILLPCCEPKLLQILGCREQIDQTGFYSCGYHWSVSHCVRRGSNP